MNCSTENCQEKARWHPILITRSKKNGPITKVVLSQIALCDHHKEVDDLDNFLSDEGFVKLSKFMKEYGKTAPVQRLITLDWKKIPPEDFEHISQIMIPERNRDNELAF